MSKELPSPELLRKLLRYEPETGKMFWRERTPDMFTRGGQSAEWACNKWNSRWAGEEAFTAIGGRGYKEGSILGRNYRAHRVIWAIVHGEWAEEIDHIHGVKDDNRISELRAVTSVENGRNKKRPSTNTSGVVGVRWNKRVQKWHVCITVGGNYKHLGLFTEFDEAVAARKSAEVKFGFHENHGRVD